MAVVCRLSLAQVLQDLQLQPAAAHDSSPQKLVLVRTGQTVGLVYFRAGYTPDDYPSEQEWQVGGSGTSYTSVSQYTTCTCSRYGLPCGVIYHTRGTADE
jgi:hypothetical protein